MRPTGPIAGRRLDHGGRGLVAACFDAQHAHACLLASAVRRYARAAPWLPPLLRTRHARQQAGADPGRPGARRAGGGRAGAGARPTRSRSSPSAPPATPSRTARWPKPAARACSSRRSRRRCWRGRIDAAVHSMKDMPTVQPPGLVIAAFLPREDARDVLIAGDVKRIADLPQGAIVGTSALRRHAQLLHLRPDLEVVILRGNVDTRLRQARSRRGRGDLARPGRPEAAGPGACRHAGARGRDAAGGRPGRGLHRMPRRRRAHARLARGHRPCADGDLRGGRACACWRCSTARAARRSPATLCSRRRIHFCCAP